MPSYDMVHSTLNEAGVPPLDGNIWRRLNWLILRYERQKRRVENLEAHIQEEQEARYVRGIRSFDENKTPAREPRVGHREADR
jgi:hypothetical protein